MACCAIGVIQSTICIVDILMDSKVCSIYFCDMTHETSGSFSQEWSDRTTFNRYSAMAFIAGDLFGDIMEGPVGGCSGSSVGCPFIRAWILPDTAKDFSGAYIDHIVGTVLYECTVVACIASDTAVMDPIFTEIGGVHFGWVMACFAAG
jgi:hypothetical protein